MSVVAWSGTLIDRQPAFNALRDAITPARWDRRHDLLQTDNVERRLSLRNNLSDLDGLAATSPLFPGEGRVQGSPYAPYPVT